MSLEKLRGKLRQARKEIVPGLDFWLVHEILGVFLDDLVRQSKSQTNYTALQLEVFLGRNDSVVQSCHIFLTKIYVSYATSCSTSKPDKNFSVYTIA